jgi:predicted acylesterase/phospholipase RssA
VAHILSPAVRWILALLVGLCSPSFSPQQLGAQTTPETNAVNRDTLIVALTVEGGGTLGSYEAGLTWALVEIFRQRRDYALRQALIPAKRSLLESLPTVDLRAAAGASAGSINAYIAANEWCSRGAPEIADSSSFWRVWIPTGMRQLLPGKKGVGGDKREKGILSRVAFNDLFGLLDRKWSRASYDTTCTVLFGATVTRMQNDSVQISEEVFARNQRFAAAFSIKPVGQGFGFPPSHTPAPRLQNSQFSLGALVELPVLANNAIDPEEARNLIRASSGFPLAFEPQQLTYCPDPSQSANPPRCDLSRATKSYFVDGGVFDNGPLTLAYGLALAHPARVTLGRLTMLFVTPSQIRGGKRSPRSAPDPAAAAVAPPEAKSAGLNAVTKLFAAFVPSARQYELQIAHRLLPTIQESDSQQNLLKYQRDSARRAAGNHGENVLRVQEAREREWDAAIVARDSLRHLADTLRHRLAVCVVNRACIPLATDSLLAAGLPPVFQASPPSKPEDATSYPPPEDRPESVGQSFEKSLYATRRWHHLSGDWLLGFGGLLGRPLREYDFYVGVYDALALLADRMLCATKNDPDCLKQRLKLLITHPFLPLTETDSTVLAALYDEEYGTRSGPGNLDKRPRREAMVLPVVWAMGDWKKKRDSEIRRCSGGSVESYECAEGIEFVFRKLRETPGYVDRLKSAPFDCRQTRMPVSECVTDSTFAEIVADPYAGLNKLVGRMLSRVAETTPRSSKSTMMLVSIGTAMYFATNERARLGRDMGSTSLPTGRPLPSRVIFAVMPSSVGGFAGVEGWYFEWAARYHFGRNIALGATARAVLMSGFTHPGGANEDHAVPGVRLEWKIPGPIGPWISTVGLDATTWTDGVTLPRHINKTTASWGGTALFLAQRVRVSLQSRPAKYRIRGRERPWGLVSIGFGDTNGFVYWLGRRFFSFVK